MSDIILIPAYKPDNKLLKLIQSLKKIKNAEIAIIDNGNEAEYNELFDIIENEYKVIIIKVTKNKGKGYGIKFGINYLLKNSIDFKNLIFADADGQHTFNDISKMIDACKNSDMAKKFIIGNRIHSSKTPYKNLIGNKIFNFLMKKLKKIYHNDCLCGLRAISNINSSLLLQVPENGFDFEITSIYHLISKKIILDEVIIPATYHDNHKSHFKIWMHSYQLIKLLFK